MFNAFGDVLHNAAHGRYPPGPHPLDRLDHRRFVGRPVRVALLNGCSHSAVVGSITYRISETECVERAHIGVRARGYVRLLKAQRMDKIAWSLSIP